MQLYHAKKIIKIILMTVLLMITQLTNAVPMMAMPEELNKARQLILILTNSWDANTGKLQRYVRDGVDDSWRLEGDAWDVMVGRNGLAWSAGLATNSLSGPIKKEGDGKTPAGIFTLGHAFGFSLADTELKLPYWPLAVTTVCVDDVNSKYYGQIIDSAKVDDVDWQSAEIMHNYPQQYQQGVVINYNTKGEYAGGGSCIFLHVKSKTNHKGTAGCTAMSISQVNQLSHWMDPQAHPVIVQLPKQQYEQLQIFWKLPGCC